MFSVAEMTLLETLLETDTSTSKKTHNRKTRATELLKPTAIIKKVSIRLITSNLLSDSQNDCSNALPFNLVHFPKRNYPGKLT